MSETTQGENPWQAGIIRFVVVLPRAIIVVNRDQVCQACVVELASPFKVVWSENVLVADPTHDCCRRRLLFGVPWNEKLFDSEDEANAEFDRLEAEFVRG